MAPKKSKKRQSPPNPRVAERITGAMDHGGVNQTELARKIGRSVSAVNQIVSGSVMPRDETVRRIAMALGEDFEFLMAHTDRGSKGYGALFGRLMAKLSADEAQYLDDLPAEELSSLIGEHAVKYAARQRKKTREEASLKEN